MQTIRTSGAGRTERRRHVGARRPGLFSTTALMPAFAALAGGAMLFAPAQVRAENLPVANTPDDGSAEADLCLDRSADPCPADPAADASAPVAGGADLGLQTVRSSLLNGGLAPQFTFVGDTITYADGETVNSAFNLSLALTKFSIASGTATQTGAILSEGGTFAVEKIGAGTLTFSGNNTYSGTTTISAGTLIAASDLALGSAAAGTIVSSGAALGLQGGISIGDALTLNGSGVSGAGALRNISGNNTLTGNITLGSAATIASNSGLLAVFGAIDNGGNLLTLTGNGNSAFVGAISGSGGITKTGAGQADLNGTNTYTGVTTVNSGVLILNGGSAIIDTGRVVVNGGAFATFNNETIGSLEGTGGFVSVSTGSGTTRLTVGGNNLSTTYSGDLRDNGGGLFALGKIGTGTLTLANNNSYSGGTTISAGTLQIGNGGTTGTIGAGAVTNNAALVFNRSNAFTVANAISGTGSLTKQGAGNMTLSGANSYTGATTVEAGTLTVIGTGALGTAAGGTTVNAGATLAFGLGASIADDISFSGTGVGGVGALNALAQINLGGNMTLTGDGSLSVQDGQLIRFLGSTFTGVGNAVLTVNTNGNSTIFLNSALGGIGGLVKNGTGQLELSNTNSFTGPITINAGVLQVFGGAAIADSVSVTGAGTGTLSLSSNETIGSLAGTGNVFLFNNSVLTTGANNASTVYAGQILAEGTGGLTKVGTGTFTLTGTNSYAGTTTISAGTLQIGNGTTTGTLGTGNVVNNATLAFNRSNNLTVANAISGTGLLLKVGGATLTLSGVNTSTGNVTISAGRLAMSGGQALGDTSAVTISGSTAQLEALASETIGSLAGIGNTIIGLSSAGVTLTTGGNNLNTTYSGSLSGLGSLVKSGSGTFVLDGNNATLSGSITISQGTLQIGSGGTGGTLSGGNVVNNGALVFNRSDDFTVANAISGNGGITKLGAGTLTLSGNNVFTGTTVVDAGTIIAAAATALGNGSLNLRGSGTKLIADFNGALPSSVAFASDVTLAAATGRTVGTGALQFLSGSNARFGSATETGTIVWNAFFGSTVSSTSRLAIDGGTVRIGSADGASGFKSVVDFGLGFTINAAGTLDMAGQSLNISKTGGTGTILNSGAASTLTLSNSTFAGTLDSGPNSLTLAGTIAGEGRLAKRGAGTLILASGLNTAAFTGGLTLIEGTLSLQGNLASTFGTIRTDGSVIDYADGVTNAAPIQINSNSTQLQVLAGSATQSGVISELGGSRGFDKIGAGTLTLSVANTYTGATRISSGALRIAADSNLGVGGALVFGGGTLATTASFAIARDVTLDAAGGTFAPDPLTSLTLSGAIRGPGALTKSGTGTLLIAGNALTDYAGGTFVNQGGLFTSGTGALGTGDITLAAGTRLGAFNNASLANRVVMTGAANFESNVGATLTLAGAITGGQPATFNGTVVLAGDNSFSTATISAGSSLTIGTGGTSGTLGTGTVTNSGTLTFNRANDFTAANVIGGTGTLTKLGAGNLTLSGASTYSGLTTVSAGTLTVANALALGTTGGGTTVNNGATLAVQGGLGVSEAITLNGSGVGAGGALRKTTAGNTQLLGLVTLASASQINSDIGDLLMFGGITGTNQNLTIGGAGRVLLDGTLQLGNGRLIKIDTGTLLLNPSAVAQLSEVVVNAGFVQVANSLQPDNGALVDTAVLTMNGGGIGFARSETIGSLSGAAGQIGDFGNGRTLTVGGNGLSTEFGGAFVESLGLTKQGTGTLTLTGASTSTGAITISGGTLQVGNGGTTGALGSGAIVNNAALVFNRSNNFTASNAISGTGSLTKLGAGTLTLTGANTYSGLTTISAGTLQIGNGGTTGSLGSGGVTNNGALVLNRSDDITLANSISGTGSLLKLGSGGATLTGALALGSIRVEAGTLTLTGISFSPTVATVAGGTLVYTRPGAGGLGGTTVQDGGSLILRSASSGNFTAGTLTLSGTGVGGAGALRNQTPLTATSASAVWDGVVLAGDASIASEVGVLQLTNITGAGRTLTVQGDAATTIAGLSTGTGGLVKTGAGTLTLAGTNTYSGGTIISAGRLQVGADANLGAATGGITIGNGVLAANASFTSARSISVTGAAGIDAATGTILTLSSAITGAGSLAKTGDGQLVLTGNNSYAGTTTISGSGGLTVGTGGTTGALGTGNVVINAGSFLAYNRSDAFTVANAIAGAGTLGKQGSGTLTLTGASTFTGGLSVGGGTVVLASAAAGVINAAGTGSVQLLAGTSLRSDVSGTLGNALSLNGTNIALAAATGTTLRLAGAITLGGTLGSTLTIGSAAAAGTIELAPSTVTIGEAAPGIALNGGTLRLANANAFTFVNAGPGITINGATLGSDLSGSLTRVLTIGAAGGTVDVAAGTLTLQSDLTGAGGLTKTGAGELRLAGAVNATGTVQLNAGTLGIVAGNTGGWGNGALQMATGTTLSVDVPLGATYAGNITLGAGAGSTILSRNTTLSGTLSGGTLNVGALTGSNFLVLRGNNTYGATNLAAGARLQIGNGGTTGTLGTGTVTLGTGSVLSIVRSDNLTSDNVIIGNGTVQKFLGNTLTLTGNNTATDRFTGSATIAGGTVLVNGTFGDVTGRTARVTVATGAALGGTGTIAGNVFINDGGILTPGTSAGTLTVAGNLTLSNSSVLNFELGQPGTIGGTVNDLVTVGGNLTLDGILNVTALSGFGAGYYRLFNYGGTLTNNVLTAGTLPTGFISTILTDIAGQVNVLFNSGAQQVQYWDGTDLTGALATVNGEGGAGSWTSAATNWTSPTGFAVNSAWAGQLGIFAGAAGGAVSITGTQAFQELRFQTDGYRLTAATSGSGLSTTGGFSIVNVGTFGNKVQIEAPIAGTGGLTKTGSGELILRGAHTYTGLTTVSSGTLSLLDKGTIAGSVLNNAVLIVDGTVGGLVTNTSGMVLIGTVAGGIINAATGTASIGGTFNGTISNSGSITLVGATTGTGAFVQTAGASFNLGGNNASIGSLAGAGTVNLGSATLTTGSANTSTDFAGIITGTGGLTKTGTGTQTLSGINTFTGPSTISGGTLQIVAGGSIVSNVTNGASLNNAGTISGGVVNNGTLVSSGVLGAGLINNAAGTAFVSGRINGDVINQGNVTLTGATVGIVNVAQNAGTIGLNGFDTTIGSLSGAGGTIALGTAALTLSGTGFASTTFDGRITGTGSLIKNGPSTFSLSGAQGYTGLTTINGGTLIVGASGSLAGAVQNNAVFNNGGTVAGLVTNAGTLTSSGTLAAGLTNALGGAANLRGNVAGTLTNAGTIALGGVLGGSAAFNQAGTGTLNLFGFNANLGSLAGSGTILLGSGALTVGSANTSTDFAGVITGTGGLIKTGTGTQTLSGSNTYTGLTTVNQGAIFLATGASLAGSVQNNATLISAGTVGGLVTNAGTLISSGNLAAGLVNNAGATVNLANGVNGAITNAGTVTLTGNLSGTPTFVQAETGVLNLAGFNAAFGSLAGSGAVQLGTGNLTVGGNDASTAFDGTVAGSGSLNKVGLGTLVLGGSNTAAQNFTGTFNASGGAVVLTGSFGDVVANAATLNVANGVTLGGNGSFLGSVNLAAGGSIFPGTSPGTLAIAGDLTLAAGSVLNFELAQAGVIGGGINDLITVGGNLTLAGTANIFALPGFGEGIYRIINYGGALTDNGFGLGLRPDGFTASLITSVAGQVSVQFTLGRPTVLYWDGTDSTGASNAPTGNGGAGVWNSATTNWTSAPGFSTNFAWGGQMGVFAGAAGGTVEVSGQQAFQQLRFETGGYTLTSASGGGSLLTTGGTSIIDVAGGLTASVNTAIEGTAGLAKAGAGTLTLGGANTFSGLTSIAEGTLVLASGARIVGAVENNATFDNSGTITGAVTNRGTLTSRGSLLGGLTNTGTATLFGRVDGITNTGTITVSTRLRVTGTFAQTASGVLDLANAGGALGNLTGAGQIRVGTGILTIGGTGNAGEGSFAGVISGSGDINKNGEGTLVLTGANTFTGLTSIITGGLTIAAGASLGGEIFNRETFTNAGTFSGRVISSTGSLITNTGTITGEVSTSGTLTSSGIILGGLSSSGTATLSGRIDGGIDNQGTITLAGSLRAVGAFTQTNTGIFDLAGRGVVLGSLAGEGQVRIGSGVLTVGSNGTSTSFAGVISGTGALNKQGSGTLTLTGANTFSGVTAINTGGLTIAAGASLGGEIQNADRFTNAGTVNGVVRGFTGSVTTNTGTITGAVINGGTLTSSGIILGGLTNASTATLSGRIDGGIANAGTITLSGTLRAVGAFTQTASGVIDLAGRGAAVGSLAGEGQVRIGSGILTIGIGTSTGAGTFAGVISGTGTINKNGSGTFTLTGANTFSGVTAIEFGGLAIASGASLGGEIQNGGTFTNAGTFGGLVRSLSGSVTTNTGTITGAVINGGTLTSSGTILGGLTNNAAATLSGRIDGGIANARTITLAGTLRATGAFTQTASGVFDLAGRGAVLGSLAGDGEVRIGAGILTVGGNNASTTFAGVISGTGAFNKLGSGTLTLTGVNTFSGLTTIEAGTLVIGAGATLGAAATAAGTPALAVTDAPATTPPLAPASLAAPSLANAAGSAVIARPLSPLGAAPEALPGTAMLVNGPTAMDSPLPVATAPAGMAPSLADGRVTVSLATTGDIAPSGERLALAPQRITGGPPQVELPGDPANAAASMAIGPADAGGAVDAPSPFGLTRELRNGAATVQMDDAFTVAAAAPGAELAAGPATAPIAGAAPEASAVPTAAASAPSSAVLAGSVLNNAGLVNNGTILGQLFNSAGATAINNGTIAGAVNNAGTLTSVGTLGGGLTNSGTARIAGVLAGEVFNAGSITLTGITTGITLLEQTPSGRFDLGGFDTTIGLLSGSGTITLGNARLTTGINGTNSLFAGVISGNGALTKTGSGGLILTGANTYAGGTTIAAGALQLGNGGTTGSIVGPVLNNGTFIINRSDAYTFAGVISGTGVFVQAGSGTTTLTGANTYSGGTRVAAGRLVGSTISLRGLIQNDAALEFAQAANGVFAGNIFGTGLLDKTGTGLLELTGDSGALRGATTVRAGELRVTGSLAGSATTVLSGATLSGNGTVGGLVARSGAVIAPGADGLGVLGVNGAIRLETGSTLRLQIQAAQGADALIGNGAVQLGGTAAIANLGGVYAFNSRYVLLQTSGTRSGTFDAVTGFADFGILYRPELLYTANQVVLRMAPNQLGNIVGGASLTPNQRAVISVIDTAVAAGYNPQPLFNVYSLAAAQQVGAFDQLSGEAYATAAGVGVEQERLVREAVLGRVAAVAAAARTAPEAGSGPGAWGQVLRTWGDGASDGNAARYESDREGFITGIDYGSADGERSWRAGAYGFHLTNRVSVAARGSRVSIDQTGGGVYASANFGGLGIAVGASLAGVDLTSVRQIALTGFAETNRGFADGRALQTFAEVSYTFQAGKATLRPFLGGAAGRFRLDGLTESGGAAALTVQRQRYDGKTLIAGADGAVSLGKVRLAGSLAGRLQIGDRDPAALVALAAAPGQAFAVEGIQLDRLALAARFDATVALSRNADLSVGYTGLIGKDTADHGARATISVRF